MIQRINLLPEELRTVNKKPLYLIAFISVAVYLSILYVVNYNQRGSIGTLESKKYSLQQSEALLAGQNAKHQEIIDKINLTESKRLEMEARAGLIKRISDENIRWSSPLYKLSNIVPAGLWFYNLSSYDSVTGDKKIKGLKITGMALSNSSIMDFMTALEASTHFTSVSLGYVQNAEYNGRKAFSFEITSIIKDKG